MTRRLVLAGAAALALAGCGGGGDEPQRAKPEPSPALGDEAQQAIDELDANAATRNDSDAIVELLRERAMATAAGDVLALEATATGAQEARDRRSARRIRRLGLAAARYAVEDVQTDGPAARARVTFAYRVRGLPRPFVVPRRVTLRKHSVGWRVVQDAPRGERLPWEVAAFRAVRTRHIVLLTAPGVDRGALLPGLDRAYREIRRALPGRELPERVLVIAARDGRMTEVLNGRLARGVVALANVSVTYRAGPAEQVGRVLAQRMIVVHDRWRGEAPEVRQATLVHEMTHTALDADTSGRTPAWLAEGVAMYVSGDDRSAEAAARAAGDGPALALGPISPPGSIFRLGGRLQGAAYATASAAAYAIVARAGTEGLFRLYDAFNAPRFRGRPGVRLTDRVLRRTLGLSLAELDAEVAG